MAGSSDERSVDKLRRSAEEAIREGRGRLVVEPILEAILESAGDDDPARAFAHRHLAELLLERDPWTAALHLRKVITRSPADDVAHSLMALSQALLGNYRAAAAAYRRALRVAPRNLWYHHNLGHLLDVALDAPASALPHLEFALAEADANEHEITASAAHCLARLGQLTEAEELATLALEADPRNEGHKALVRWVKLGAPADQPVHLPLGSAPAAAPPVRFVNVASRTDVVGSTFDQQMFSDGFSDPEIAAAHALWRDYKDVRTPKTRGQEVYAAAVHYIIAGLVDRRVSQASLARAYFVSARTLSTRSKDIREALEIQDADARYVPV